ncbi:MAG: TetR/AcrR family transcriptional regulator [Propionibacteriaceae bacterium]|nr:TetR/AcrR family transcriptional regulator [Propionibacteriaceae bacterium]
MESERSLANEENMITPTSPDTTRTRARNTRDALLDAALAGFSRDGFSGTSIRDLARAIGIRESSVYKHFVSKQAILDALVERIDERLGDLASHLGTVTSTGEAAAATYQDISEEALVGIARGMFDFVVDDPEFAALRRMMVIEQFRDADVSARLHDYFITQPLAFQTELFRVLLASGEFLDGLDPQTTALAFFGPIYMLIDYADGGDKQRALDLLAGHVHHFRLVHLRNP